MSVMHARAVRRREQQNPAAGGPLDLLRALGWVVRGETPWPGRRDETVDHLVAGPAGAFVVCLRDTDDALEEFAHAADELTQLLDGNHVEPILCLRTSTGLDQQRAGVRLCSPDTLLDTLLRSPAILEADAARELGVAVRDLEVPVPPLPTLVEEVPPPLDEVPAPRLEPDGVRVEKAPLPPPPLVARVEPPAEPAVTPPVPAKVEPPVKIKVKHPVKATVKPLVKVKTEPQLKVEAELPIEAVPEPAIEPVEEAALPVPVEPRHRRSLRERAKRERAKRERSGSVRLTRRRRTEPDEAALAASQAPVPVLEDAVLEVPTPPAPKVTTSRFRLPLGAMWGAPSEPTATVDAEDETETEKNFDWVAMAPPQPVAAQAPARGGRRVVRSISAGLVLWVVGLAAVATWSQRVALQTWVHHLVYPLTTTYGQTLRVAETPFHPQLTLSASTAVALPAADGQRNETWYAINVVITDTGTRAEQLPAAAHVSVRDSWGDDRTPLAGATTFPLGTSLAAGGTASGRLVFAMPTERTPGALRIDLADDGSQTATFAPG